MPQDQVFISYSHKDERWHDELNKHLKPYLRGKSIVSWSDQQIAPGSEWFKEIQSALANSKVAVASASTCFPDADPTMTPRDRPLHPQVRADVPNKKPRMSAMPPDKRFAYWDCAPALPRAQGRSPQFWLGSILKFPPIDQSEQEALLQSLSANPLAS